MKSKLHIFSCLVLGFICASCAKEPYNTNVAKIEFSNSLILLNEGNYGWGEGEVSVTNLVRKTTQNSVFSGANGIKLGNVVHSMARLGPNLFGLVVNNSSKIVLVDSTFKAIAEVSGLQSPRHILSLPNGLAYVSDLFAEAIHIVDLSKNKKVGTIPISGWTEQMVLHNGLVYVATSRRMFDSRPGGQHILILSPTTNQLVDSIYVGKGAEELCLINGTLFTAIDSSRSGAKPQIVSINLSTKAVSRAMLNGPTKPHRLSPSPDAAFLFFLHQGIKRLEIATGAIRFVGAKPTANLTSLKVGHQTTIDGQPGYRIFFADALDYVRAGKLYFCFAPNAGALQVQDSATVGVIPGFIYLP